MSIALLALTMGSAFALIAKPMNEETMLKPEELKKELKHGQKDLMAAQSQMKKEMNEKASEQVLKKIQNGKFEKENEEMMKKSAENLQKNQPQANTEDPERLQRELIQAAENEEAKKTFDTLVKEGQADQL